MIWLLFYILVAIFLFIGGYLAYRFLKPRCPEWWKRHICDVDPQERKQNSYAVN